MENFDPYHKWLGIPKSEQPANHYRLLGVALFESDLDVIEAAADRQMAYVKQCATGPHLALSQKLLNELSAARVTLLVPAKRQAYDAQLRMHLDEEDLIAKSLEPVILKESANKPESTNPFPTEHEPKKPARSAKSQSQKKSGNRKSKPKSSSLPWIVGALVLVVCVVGLMLVSPLFKGSPQTNVTSTTNSAKQPNPEKAPEVNQIDVSAPMKTLALEESKAIDSTPESNPRAKPDATEIAARKGPFSVVEAQYGVQDKWFDLTRRIEVAEPGLIGVVVHNSLVGQDPKFGVSKRFLLRYQFLGRNLSESVRDERSIVVVDSRMPPEIDPKGSLIIHDAIFGRGIVGEGSWTDVADRLRNLIVNDGVESTVHDVVGTANSDSSHALFVRWSCRGLWWTSAFLAPETVRLGTQSIAIQQKEKAAVVEDDADLVIYEATYGAHGSYADLTERVQNAVKATGRLVMVPNNLLVPTDPSPNNTKHLRVRYRLFGRPFDQLFGENSVVVIDGQQRSDEEFGDGLKILSAFCGHGIFGEPKMLDVTRQVQLLVQDNKLQMPANAVMDQVGGSIRPRWLTIRYALDGEAHTADFDDRDTLSLGVK